MLVLLWAFLWSMMWERLFVSCERCLMVKPQRLDVSHVSRMSTKNIGNGGQAAKTIFFRKREQERTMIAWAFATMLDGSVLSGLN